MNPQQFSNFALFSTESEKNSPWVEFKFNQRNSVSRNRRDVEAVMLFVPKVGMQNDHWRI